jgi:hypothetical protein
MNWPLAISRNRTALLAVVAAIVALLGGRVLRPFDKLRAQDEGGAISRQLRNAALALLRPAEAATRRLIVIAARGIVAAPRPATGFAGVPQGDRAAARSRPPAFRLVEPLKRYGRVVRRRKPGFVPRIRTFFGPPLPAPPPIAAPPDPRDQVDSTRLRRRLAALERALADLPRQARRLARWRARASRFRPSPLRLGHPPGHRQRGGREIDLVLRECHLLACDALADTS